VPGGLRYLRWMVIVVWCAVLVLAVTVYALGLPVSSWMDYLPLAVALLAVLELWDWLK
jgi:hypothetical protein